MNRLLKYLKTIDRRWLVTWLFIYVGFILLDLLFDDFVGETILKLTGIALCAVYAYQKFKKDSLLVIAMAFTMLADVILAVNNTAIIGVFTFCFAQFFHTARLQKTKPSFLAFYFAVVVIIFFVAVSLGIDPMYAISGIYAYGIFSNFYLAIRWYSAGRSTASICAAVGFFLFVCCDICVALSYLGLTGVLPFIFKRIGDFSSWVFYYPAQVLISNSSDTSSRSAAKTLKTLAKS